MYISPDDDRSDLFLAGAVYLIGGEILGVFLSRIPFPAAASLYVSMLVIVATTILVPLLLMRYRQQRPSHFGFDNSYSAVGAGFVASLPVVLAYVVATFAGGISPVTALPLGMAIFAGGISLLVFQVVAGFCVVLLAIYTTVKARNAFRDSPAYIAPTMAYLARFAGIAAAVASLLLFLTALRDSSLGESLQVLLVPVGVAASGYLVYRSIRGSQLTSRATLLTPMVLLAVSSFVVFAPAAAIVAGIWRAAVLAGIGLVIGALLESRRTAWAPVGFALGLTLLTPLLL